MIIPWGTDAPIYHRPFATIALIVLNVLAFVLFPARAHEDWTLVLGEGIHPLQWLTNIFLHAGIFHLAGNMIFLWTFGFVIEGKIGWWRFAMIYLTLGVVESAVIQLLVHSEQPFVMLGSSTVIFGLLAICLVWAPRNEVTCIVWLRFTPMEFDLSILWFAVVYIAIDVMTSGMSGVIMASLTDHSNGVILTIALAQTFGALLGLILGAVLLKLKLVDCENWDLFAVLEGRAGKSKRQARKEMRPRRPVAVEYAPPAPNKVKRGGKARSAVSSVEDPSSASLRAMRQHLEFGEVEAALAVYRKSTRSVSRWQPPERDWRDLIEALLGQDLWEDAAQVMRDYVRNQPEASPRVRLKLAQVLIQKLGRPLQGLRLLGQFPEGSLPESLETIRRQLAHQAEAMQEDGPLELEDELW
ncbi:MAG: rhomboid family intramembrane serine protease [Isosphaeraceae bacterium]